MMHLAKIILALFFLSCSTSYAQKGKSVLREGNRYFKAEKFEESEIAYRKALDTEVNSIPGTFNLGDALYKQEKFDEAEKHFSVVGQMNTSREIQSNAFHNLGNTLLQAGKIDESIEAYKDALRRNPDDMETKYNLAYAQKLKQEQQEQEQQDQKDNQDQDDQKDQKDNQDQQDKQNQENQEDQKDNQDQQDQQDQQDNQDQQDQQKQQDQPGNISKNDAERMLNALANQEQETQEKVKVAKAKAQKVRTLKDW